METKEAVFEEKDSVWTAVRHMHMQDAKEKLLADFNKFHQENMNFADRYLPFSACPNRRTKAKTVNDIMDMMASVPEVIEAKSQFSLHFAVVQRCTDIFTRKKLMELGLLEQVFGGVSMC
jgi:syntaxin-binding protein 1